MTPPKQLMEAAEKAYRIEFERQRGALFFKDANEGKEWKRSIAEFFWRQAWKACLKHLCELSAREFDEIIFKKSFAEVVKHKFGKLDYVITDFEIAAARHQHTLDMAALLKAREERAHWIQVASADTDKLNRAQDNFEAAQRELKVAKKESEANFKSAESWKEQALEKFELIDELEAAKQEIARLKDIHQGCSNLVIRHDSLQARVKELEAALRTIVTTTGDDKMLARIALKDSGDK